MKLAERLVKDLKGDHADTLSRWIAHYIAEQMEAAKEAAPEDKSKAEEAMFRRDFWHCGRTETKRQMG